MYDRAVIESDLADKGRVEEEPEWAQRARFSYRIKGILINPIDYEINKMKKKEQKK